MKQQTLAVAAGFERFGRSTRRSEFLSQMNVVVPWSELVALIEPHYPKAANGRPPVGLERMLRIYFRQQWFNLSDPAVEDALYDSVTMRSFVGIDLGREPAPDETTVCKFHHLLERHDLGRKMLGAVNAHLDRHGLKIGTGIRNRMDQAYLDKLDGKIPVDFWERKMSEWRAEEQEAALALEALKQSKPSDRALTAQKIFELANTAYSRYISQNPTEQAKLLKTVLSNCSVGDEV